MTISPLQHRDVDKLAGIMGELRDYLTDGIEYWTDVQATISDLPYTATEPTPENVRTFCFALIKEVTEFADELGWKSWKRTPPNRARALEESADILAFTGLFLCWLRNLGYTPEDIVTAYADKCAENIRRLTGSVGGGYEVNREKK